MKNEVEDPAKAQGRLSEQSTFHIIVLGSGGGPNEDNVTGLLVRSTATNWAKGSVLAVDGGTHLAAIIRILEQHFPKKPKPRNPDDTVSGPETRSRTRATLAGNHGASPAASPHPSGQIKSNAEATGHVNVQRARPEPFSLAEEASSVTRLSDGPFAGLGLPCQTAKANATYINRTLVNTYLITHPHLDHLAGFAVNTASFQHTYRPKRLAALPSTIDAVKDHIFNDVIWPNLSDEDGGVGLVTYMRLAEGGNVALGTGDGMGYIEVCDGLAVKCWSVSHGHCMKRHSHRGSQPNSQTEASAQPNPVPTYPTSKACVYDSSAFFIRDHRSGNEILIFGDVEPDSISLSPRTAQVWRDAAPKIVAGTLKGIFIECSYDDSQSDDTLFGHLCPRHLIAELQALAAIVTALRHPTAPARRRSSDRDRKRKRHSNGLDLPADPDVPPSRLRTRSRGPNPPRAGSPTKASTTTTASVVAPPDASASASMPAPADPLPLVPAPTPASAAPTSASASAAAAAAAAAQPPPPPPTTTTTTTTEKKPPLDALQIIIIHMKDTLSDGPDVGESILAQLLAYETEVRLGCTFVISSSGWSVWL